MHQEVVIFTKQKAIIMLLNFFAYWSKRNQVHLVLSSVKKTFLGRVFSFIKQ